MRKKLLISRKDRIKSYQNIIEKLKQIREHEEAIYVCIYLSSACSALTGHYAELEEIEMFFPEFYKQKPEEATIYDGWWDMKDKKSRIEALERSIKLAQENKSIFVRIKNYFKQVIFFLKRRK